MLRMEHDDNNDKRQRVDDDDDDDNDDVYKNTEVRGRSAKTIEITEERVLSTVYLLGNDWNFSRVTDGHPSNRWMGGRGTDESGQSGYFSYILIFAVPPSWHVAGQ